MYLQTVYLLPVRSGLLAPASGNQRWGSIVTSSFLPGRWEVSSCLPGELSCAQNKKLCINIISPLFLNPKVAWAT